MVDEPKWMDRPATVNNNDPLGVSEKPKIVVMCGSSRFCDIMAVAKWLIERDELAITMGLHLLPVWYPDCPDHHLAEHECCNLAMDELHLRKIDLADEVFVVNFDGYIGDSTKREISYAESKSVKVRYFTSDYIGQAVLKLIIKGTEQLRKKEASDEGTGDSSDS